MILKLSRIFNGHVMTFRFFGTNCQYGTADAKETQYKCPLVCCLIPKEKGVKKRGGPITEQGGLWSAGDGGLGKHPARPRGGRAVSASRGRQVGAMILCMGGGWAGRLTLGQASYGP